MVLLHLVCFYPEWDKEGGGSFGGGGRDRKKREGQRGQGEREKETEQEEKLNQKKWIEFPAAKWPTMQQAS